MAPAGTPKPIVDKLNAEINKVLSSPSSKPNGPSRERNPDHDPSEFEAYLREDIEKWAKVIETAGIKVQQ
jgi:tripartite-type tricarboxylate transporter receptor subunit TctC